MKMLALLLYLVSTIASAGYISIPLSDPAFKLAPASDLSFEGKVLTTTEAMELAQKGIDLSELNPKVSSLYKNKKLSLETNENYKALNLKYIYHSALTAPTEFFRASINIKDQNYTISASLYNHQTLLRASLLRLIGYDVEMPKFLHKFRLDFNSLIEKKNFIESLVEKTLLAKSRWLVDPSQADDNEKRLDLKGFLLEPADLKNVSVYWPVMEQSRQIQRRLFRALFYLYALTDFEEQINLVDWHFGKVFNNELNLNHSYYYAFTHVTIEDIKWIHRKISTLSEDELKKAIQSAKWPYEVSEILFEKLKSRLNSIGEKIGLDPEYNVQEKLNLIGVVNGKLNVKSYPEYVPSFWEEDPLSPFRFSEIFKLFRSQIAYDSISGIFDSAQSKFIPNISTSDALKKISNQVKNNYRETGSIPLKVWAHPIYQGSVSGNRSIVFGQYQGSIAPIQLVDRMAIEFKTGIVGLVSGLPTTLKPNYALQAAVKRSWSHVRAMPDLSTATEQKISKIYVPGLMKNLATVFNNNQDCSLKSNAWYTEEIITTFKTWVIYFDKEDSKAKEAALKIRQQLVEQDIPEDKILFNGVSKESLCEKEITSSVNDSLEKFIKQFAMDETITITDSLEVGRRIGVRVDPSRIDELSIDLSQEKSKALLRSIILRKTAEGIEVTIQKQKNTKKRFKQEVELFIELFSLSWQKQKGLMESNIYKIKLVDITHKEKVAAINTLREILLRGSFDNLKEYYNPIILDHEVDAKIGTFKFLWKKSEKLKMNHEVEITVANKPHNIDIILEPTEDDEWSVPQPLPAELPISERQRTLYNVIDIKRSGNNYHSFLDSTLSDITFDWLKLGASDQDPGRSIYGKSKSNIYITEVELTPKYETKPITKIEYRFIGWKSKMGKLNRILNKIEDIYNFEGSQFKIDREIFNDTKKFYSYDIRSTIILYPSAFEQIKENLIHKSEIEQIKTLKKVMGPTHWQRICGDNHSCIPHDVLSIIRLIKKGYSNQRKEIAHFSNMLFKKIFESFNKANVLSWLGTKNFFSTTYISGFRSDDSEGYLQYTSDSVGTYQDDYGTGTFDYIASNLGITAYTLKAMNYTPGME